LAEREPGRAVRPGPPQTFQRVRTPRILARLVQMDERNRLGVVRPDSAPRVLASDGDRALRSVTRIASFRRFGL